MYALTKIPDKLGLFQSVLSFESLIYFRVPEHCVLIALSEDESAQKWIKESQVIDTLLPSYYFLNSDKVTMVAQYWSVSEKKEALLSSNGWLIGNFVVSVSYLQKFQVNLRESLTNYRNHILQTEQIQFNLCELIILNDKTGVQTIAAQEQLKEYTNNIVKTYKLKYYPINETLSKKIQYLDVYRSEQFPSQKPKLVQVKAESQKQKYQPQAVQNVRVTINSSSKTTDDTDIYSQIDIAELKPREKDMLGNVSDPKEIGTILHAKVAEYVTGEINEWPQGVHRPSIEQMLGSMLIACTRQAYQNLQSSSIHEDGSCIVIFGTQLDSQMAEKHAKNPNRIKLTSANVACTLASQTYDNKPKTGAERDAYLAVDVYAFVVDYIFGGSLYVDQIHFGKTENYLACCYPFRSGCCVDYNGIQKKVIAYSKQDVQAQRQTTNQLNELNNEQSTEQNQGDALYNIKYGYLLRCPTMEEFIESCNYRAPDNKLKSLCGNATVYGEIYNHYDKYDGDYMKTYWQTTDRLARKQAKDQRNMFMLFWIYDLVYIYGNEFQLPIKNYQGNYEWARQYVRETYKQPKGKQTYYSYNNNYF